MNRKRRQPRWKARHRNAFIPELKVVGVGRDVCEEEGVGDGLDHVAAPAGALRVVPQHAAGRRPRVPAARADEHPVHRQPRVLPVRV